MFLRLLMKMNIENCSKLVFMFLPKVILKLHITIPEFQAQNDLIKTNGVSSFPTGLLQAVKIVYIIFYYNFFENWNVWWQNFKD